jgi:hypothetical protein
MLFEKLDIHIQKNEIGVLHISHMKIN